MKLISVIIPMYNAQNTIDRMLTSIINQTYTNLEIIIINDGSTDKSLSMIGEYQKKDSRIKVFSIKNSGVSHARNVGLTKVKGEYVQFVDADDDLELNYFEKMSKMIEDNDCDVAICNNKHPLFYAHFEKDEVLDVTSHDEFIKFYQHTFAITLPWNKLWKKEIIDGLFFEEDLDFSEDEAFTVAALGRIKKVAVTKDVLYHYFLANKNNGGDQTSTINNQVNKAAFWDNHTSIYYKQMGCLPAKLEYIFNQIVNKQIPISNPKEILYCRLFEYTFYQYALYESFGIPKHGLLIEMVNIINDPYFHMYLKSQEEYYHLKFINVLDKNLIEVIKKLNDSMYKMFEYVQKNNVQGFDSSLTAIMIFAHYFIVENNDINNVNLLNQLDKEFKENKTLSANIAHKFVD